jgi:uncharacterized protein (TIGR02246 family)
MILPGLYRKGRDDIRAFMADAFAGPYRGTSVTGDPLELRFLTGESGVLVTLGGVLAAGETEVSTERAARTSWVVVKQDQEWLLALYHNAPAYGR